ncbi:MAG: DUF86 domain-containing protein [Chloroflexi bacterium]|nr:DUF86 domain-containing protein [Chloroflexota bacterium]
MDLFEKQAQVQSLFQTSPVDAAYASGRGSKLASGYSDMDVAVLLLDKVRADEFLEYQLFLTSELAKALETSDLDVLILNRASLLQRANIIRSWSLLYQKDQRRRVRFEARAAMEFLEFQKFDVLQSKALAERMQGDRFAIDEEYVRGLISRLREYATMLRDLKGIERDKFTADPKLYGLGQWWLHEAVELLFGTGAYLIMALALRKPEAYHDILDTLAGRGIIDRALAYRLEHLADVRNLLAYDRDQTSVEDVQEIVASRIEDLGTFADQVERFLEGGRPA